MVRYLSTPHQQLLDETSVLLEQIKAACEAQKVVGISFDQSLAMFGRQHAAMLKEYTYRGHIFLKTDEIGSVHFVDVQYLGISHLVDKFVTNMQTLAPVVQQVVQHMPSIAAFDLASLSWKPRTDQTNERSKVLIAEATYKGKKVVFESSNPVDHVFVTEGRDTFIA